MHRAIKLGRFAGLHVSADWSLAFACVLVWFYLALGLFQTWRPQWTPATAWLAAFSVVVLYFASVLLHELTQAIVARRSGVEIRSVRLLIFGGVPHPGLKPAPPATEWRMAGAGLVLTLLVATLCFALASAESNAGSTILICVGWMNIGLCAINLLPGYPLDGGRALRAFVWAASGDHHRATWLVCRIGQAFGWGAILYGVALCLGMSVPALGREGSTGPWLMLIGWFLITAARVSYRSMLIVDLYRGLAALELLAEVAVSNLMRDVPTRMHPRDPLRDAADRVTAACEQPPLPIEADGIFLGWVRREDLASCERREVGEPRLAELMIPVNCLPTVRPEQTVAEVVALMNQCCLDYVAVVRQRRLLGMVSRDDVITWMCRGGG